MFASKQNIDKEGENKQRQQKRQEQQELMVYSTQDDKHSKERSMEEENFKLILKEGLKERLCEQEDDNGVDKIQQQQVKDKIKNQQERKSEHEQYSLQQFLLQQKFPINAPHQQLQQLIQQQQHQQRQQQLNQQKQDINYIPIQEQNFYKFICPQNSEFFEGRFMLIDEVRIHFEKIIDEMKKYVGFIGDNYKQITIIVNEQYYRFDGKLKNNIINMGNINIEIRKILYCTSQLCQSRIEYINSKATGGKYYLAFIKSQHKHCTASTAQILNYIRRIYYTENNPLILRSTVLSPQYQRFQGRKHQLEQLYKELLKTVEEQFQQQEEKQFQQNIKSNEQLVSKYRYWKSIQSNIVQQSNTEKGEIELFQQNYTVYMLCLKDSNDSSPLYYDYFSDYVGEMQESLEKQMQIKLGLLYTLDRNLQCIPQYLILYYGVKKWKNQLKNNSTRIIKWRKDYSLTQLHQQCFPLLVKLLEKKYRYSIDCNILSNPKLNKNSKIPSKLSTISSVQTLQQLQQRMTLFCHNMDDIDLINNHIEDYSLSCLIDQRWIMSRIQKLENPILCQNCCLLLVSTNKYEFNKILSDVIELISQIINCERQISQEQEQQKYILSDFIQHSQLYCVSQINQMNYCGIVYNFQFQNTFKQQYCQKVSTKIYQNAIKKKEQQFIVEQILNNTLEVIQSQVNSNGQQQQQQQKQNTKENKLQTFLHIGQLIYLRKQITSTSYEVLLSLVIKAFQMRVVAGHHHQTSSQAYRNNGQKGSFRQPPCNLTQFISGTTKYLEKNIGIHMNLQKLHGVSNTNNSKNSTMNNNTKKPTLFPSEQQYRICAYNSIDEYFIVRKLRDRWSCECYYSLKSGLPCPHEIKVCLVSGSLLIKQISRRHLQNNIRL